MNHTIFCRETGDTINICRDCSKELDVDFDKIGDSRKPCQICFEHLMNEYSSFDGIQPLAEIFRRACESDNPIHYIASSFPFRTDDITRAVVLKMIEICVKAKEGGE